VKVLGIDFGTSNTCVATIEELGQAVVIKLADGLYSLPSVVFFGPNNEVIVGMEARNMRAASPNDVVFGIKKDAGKTDADGRPIIRHIDASGKQWTNEAIAGLILAKAKKDSEAGTGNVFDTVLITVPACFDEAQRQFVLNAGAIAGFKRVFTMDEPTAAAYAYGLTKSPGTFGITDLGAGTFDVTIISVAGDGSVTPIATGGQDDLGGLKFDEVIVARVLKEVEAAGVDRRVIEDPSVRQDIKDRAENLKHSLSVRTEAQFNMFVGGKKVAFTYTRAEFEKDSRPLMDRVIAVIDETLQKGSLTKNKVDYLVQVGGATRMPMFTDRLTEYMGRPPRKDADPDTIVAKGAALTLAKMMQDAGETLLSYKDNKPVRKLAGGKLANCAAHDLGCKAYDTSGTHEEFAVIIKRNSKLPCKESQTFAMKEPGQTAVTVEVVQGEAGKPLAECRHIDDVQLAGLPVGDPRMPRIVVEYAYTLMGLVEVKVTDTVSGKTAFAKMSHILGMNEEDVKAGEQAVKQAKIQ
jgi:molecular chaperone DnaK